MTDRAASSGLAAGGLAAGGLVSGGLAADRADELLADLRRHNIDAGMPLLFEVEAIEELTEERLVVRGFCNQPGRPGAGGDGAGSGAAVIPGPVQMGIADGFGWMLTVVRLPRSSDAFTIDMSMQFLRPLPVGPFVARCELLRWSPRRTVITVDLAPAHDAASCTFITAAFASRTSVVGGQ